MLEKSFPCSLRSWLRPITAEYYNVVRISSHLKIRRTYVENDLIKELHRIAAKHQRNNMTINLAPHLVNINSL